MLPLSMCMMKIYRLILFDFYCTENFNKIYEGCPKIAYNRLFFFLQRVIPMEISHNDIY